jgi:homoserine O-succinyltransferase
MPIKIPDKLPAFDALVNEGVRVMTETAALRQDIRPLQIGLLNLMPNKIKTELQLARLLGASPLQIELTLIRVGSHKTRNTADDHMLNFYDTWEETKHRKFDGFIITGTPIETMPYEEVTYWNEMTQIFDWTSTNAHSTMLLCWGAMAALHHFHGVPKHTLGAKTFGVFRPRILHASPYLNGFSDKLSIPISRWATIRAADLSRCPPLTLLAASEEGGASIVEDREARRLYLLDHLEYDSDTLAEEYFRDVKAKVPINVPVNYFPNNDPAQIPLNRWRSHAFLLFSNWVNEIYQTSPYDLARIGEPPGA